MLQEEVVCRGGEKCVSKLHICSMVERGRDMDRIRDLVENPTHYCKNCGRTASDERYLCRPAMFG